MNILKKVVKAKNVGQQKLQKFGKSLRDVGASKMTVDNASNPNSAYSKMKRATAAKTPAKKTKGAYHY